MLLGNENTVTKKPRSYVRNRIINVLSFINPFHFITDVDECTIPGVCSGKCHNTDGSYFCACPLGFQMASDKKTCIGKYMFRVFIIFICRNKTEYFSCMYIFDIFLQKRKCTVYMGIKRAVIVDWRRKLCSCWRSVRFFQGWTQN